MSFSNTGFYLGIVALFVAVGFVIAIQFSGNNEASAEKEPSWTYPTGNSVHSVALSADGEYLAASSWDKVYLFDKDSSTPLWSYTTGSAVHSVALSADGEYLAVGSRDNRNIYLFDKDSSDPIWTYPSGGTFLSVTLSADGEYLAAGSGDNTIYLFDKDSSDPIWTYLTGGNVYSVALSADGKYLAAGSKDKNIYLFDKDSSTPLWSYTTGSDVRSVALSADGEYLTAGSWDNTIYFFDKDSSTPLWSYTTGNSGFSVAISANGDYLAAGSDSRVYLFDKDSSTPLWSYPSSGGSVALSADGKYLAAGSWDNTIYLFDKNRSDLLWSYTTGGTVYSVALSADGEYLAAGSSDRRVYLFDKDNSTPIWSRTTGGIVYSVALSADGEYLAAGSSNGRVYLFNKNNSTPIWSYLTGSNVESVAISADGEYLAAGSWDNKVYLFDKDRSDPIWNYTTGGNVYSVALSANGEHLVAGSWDKIYFFDKDSSDPIRSYATQGRVRVAISADGEYFAAGSGYPSGKEVYLFNKDNSTPIWSYTTGGIVYSVALSADGECLAAGSEDNNVYLFNKDSSDPLWSYTTGDSVYSVALSADFECLAAGSWDGGVYFLEKDKSPAAYIDFISPSLTMVGDVVHFKGIGRTIGSIVDYQWRSDLDGNLSLYNEFNSSSLSEGSHTIYFRVQDKYGIWSDEASFLLYVLNPSDDNDGDFFSNYDEANIYHTSPLVSNLCQKTCSIGHSPKKAIRVDEIEIKATIFAPDEGAESYYLHYKTLIGDWEKVKMKDVGKSPYQNLNKWLSFNEQVNAKLTAGRIINLTYMFNPYEFTTGEEIQYYITDSDGFNYNDMEQKGDDDPANVNNIKTITIESENTLIYSITDEALFSLVGSILLTLLLLKYRFYKRFEKVKYAKEIGRVSQENFIINMFQLFTKVRIKELLRSRRGGKFVTFIYFVGITGLLLIAGELFLNPKEISVLSAMALVFFLGISIIIPFLFTFFTRWKERAPLIGRFRFIVGSISLAIIILFFLAPRYYNEVLFEGTRFESNILAESEENTMYTYLAVFFLLFGVPTILYGNIMGTSWNFLVRTLSKEVRTGFSFLSWEREGISKRAISFFQLIAIAFMPLFAINALIGLAAGNYGKGGYIGVATATAIGEIGYEDFTEIASRLVAIFILLNVVLVGAAMVFRVVHLQFLNSSRFSGKWGVVYKRHGDIANSKEDQLTLILMVFGIFFGYTILLLLLSIYSHFGYLMPIIPFVSVHVMETLMIGLSATTNFFFLLFWTVSLSRTRRVLKIEKTPDGQGLIIPKTRRERKAEESFIQDFQMAVR